MPTMKTRLILTFSTVIIMAAFFAEPVPQDPAYHEFADTRALLGIDNFWNVVSNLPLILTGLAGLWFLRIRERDGLTDALYPAYLIFFGGIMLTGLGSAWYHYAPSNFNLVWDRLPMTIAFMAFFIVVVGEFVCHKSARRLLIPLLLVGAASVFWWQYTESMGAGDLRPYALVQFLPMVLIPIILFAYFPDHNMPILFFGMIGFYALSKMFELMDAEVYAAGQVISGHSMKHIVAALAAALFLWGLNKRRPQVVEVEPATTRL